MQKGQIKKSNMIIKKRKKFDLCEHTMQLSEL